MSPSMQDGLRAAKGGVGDDDLVAHRGKVGADGVGIAALDLHPVGAGEAAGGVDGGLRVHAEIGEVGDKAGVSGGLVGAAHHAEGHDDAAVLADHAGDDGVHRALAPGRPRSGGPASG